MSSRVSKVCLWVIPMASRLHAYIVLSSASSLKTLRSPSDPCRQQGAKENGWKRERTTVHSRTSIQPPAAVWNQGWHTAGSTQEPTSTTTTPSSDTHTHSLWVIHTYIHKRQLSTSSSPSLPQTQPAQHLLRCSSIRPTIRKSSNCGLADGLEAPTPPGHLHRQRCQMKL